MKKEYEIKSKETLEEQIRNNHFNMGLNILVIDLNAIGIVLQMGNYFVNGNFNSTLIATNISLLGLISASLANCIEQKKQLEKETEEYNKGGFSK